MRLIKDVTRDTLPYHENLTIRCELGQEEEIKVFMDRINPIDLNKDYEIVIRPKKEGDGECRNEEEHFISGEEKLQRSKNDVQEGQKRLKPKNDDDERKKSRHRSRNANGYYRQLASKIAPLMGMTDTQYHNINLAKLGIPWVDDAGQRDWILRKDDNRWQYFEGLHYCPTIQTEVRNGITYRWFYRLLSSKSFDSIMMSKLINLAVKDATQVGVETLTPAEIEQLKGAGYIEKN